MDFNFKFKLHNEFFFFVKYFYNIILIEFYMVDGYDDGVVGVHYK